MRTLIPIIIAFAGLSSFILNSGYTSNETYLSPTHISFDDNTGKAYVSLSTASSIAVVDIKSNKLEKVIPLSFNPGGSALSLDSKTLIVSDKRPEGQVHIISLPYGKITGSFKVGHTPDAIVVAPDGEHVFVANRFSNTVSVINLKNHRVIKNLLVDRDPKSLSISPDGKLLAVANNIPNSAATDQYISAKVTLIDVNTLEVIDNLTLANGSQSIEDVVFSRDGKYLYASHILSRNKLPTTQIERGWINSNAISLIDVNTRSYYTTVLLDNFNRGAANPSGMIVSEDGNQLFVALSGVHEICVVDLPKLHLKLDVLDQKEIEQVPNDLRFLNGIKKRIPTSGKSPRYLSFGSDKLMVSSYFSSGLEVFFDPGNSPEKEVLILGIEPKMNDERKGELLFSDADLCFQKWQSCISCHPDTRSDGLNWDLLNDGAGSPKNSKSMLFAHYTPPVMITGIRESAEVAVRAGLKFALFTDYEEADARDIDAYLKSLIPVPSPYLLDGKLSMNAKNGRVLFENAGCIGCHSGKYYTDGGKYDVGTGIHPHENAQFDVPGLSEVWRTAPYLYDGRAKTMIEVFSKFNPEDKHGATSTLSNKELTDLVEYVLSL